MNKSRQKWLWIGGLAAAALWIVFFDDYSISNRVRLGNQIDELEAQKRYYLDKIAEDSTLIEKLKDNEYLEKYAREHYYFSREGETVYLIAE